MITITNPRSRSTESTRDRRSGLYGAVGVSGAVLMTPIVSADVPTLPPNEIPAEKVYNFPARHQKHRDFPEPPQPAYR
jgi:hypothetical protein